MTWTNRYQHELTLSIRVWPQGERAFKESLSAPEWSVDGFSMNRDCHMCAAHKFAHRRFFYWEMSDTDADRLACAGHAGAKFGKMVVRTPGTKYNTAKMECWLEVPLTLNPKSWCRKNEIDPIMRGTEDEIAREVQEVWAMDNRRAGYWRGEYYGFTREQQKEYVASLPVREFTGVDYIINPEMADLNLIAEAVQKGRAILVDRSLAQRLDINEIDRALDYWRIPGAAPDAPGGEFNPLQLGRSVFWCENASVPEWLRGDGKEAVKEYRKNAHDDMMKARTQKYYVEHVTERVAKHYGISRDRVAARLIEEGFMEWMAEESEKVWNDPSRGKFPGVAARCHGPVDEAAKVLTFCIDAMAIRPPDPVPPMLTPKQQEARLEYQRKKLDAFNKLPKEEQERILARKKHRERNRPERIAKRILAAYAQEEGRPVEDVLIELQGVGIFDLIVNGIRTRKEAAKATQIVDAQAKFYERIGPKAIRLLKRCRTGEAVEARDAEKLIR